jgi:5-methylthioadenosine/S-adenosylhomocysteine deaminase
MYSMTYDIVIRNTEILEKNDGKNYNIGIKDGLISYIGNDYIEGKETIDGSGHLAVPGFVNAHTHVAMTLFRSYADDMALMDWLQHKIWPLENHLYGEAVFWGSMLGIAEMIRTGTTCYADMYFFMDDTARASAETGIRAVLSRGLTGNTPEEGKSRLMENTTLYKDWHGKCHDRIHVMYGPHAPYTCSPDFLKTVVAEAQRMNAEIHMHLCETKGEVENCLSQFGKSPIALMEELGLFELGTLAAHCVYVTDSDQEIMARHHVRVASNPQSNLKLASGIAPVASMMNKGLTVGLGTDGASSNNNLDMLEEIRLATMLAKVQTGDPKAVPAKMAVEMGTIQGAKALGLTQLGRIEKGWKADIVLYSMAEPYWYPRNDRYSLLAYAASATDVDHVIIDGKVLLKNREYKTLDIEKVCFEAEKAAIRLKSY